MDLFELRVINPSTGVADLVLPDVETYTIAPMHSGVGTLQFTYPRNGLNSSQLLNDREIAVYYNGAEVGTLRSTLEQISYDDANLNEEGDLGTYTCRMNISRLDRAIVYPPGWPTSSNPPDYTFTGATPGTMVLTLVALAQARGTIGYIDCSSFTSLVDSNGNAWTNTLTVKFTAQTDYLSLLQTLVGYAVCEAQMSVYSLHLYNFEGSGVDHTAVEPPLIMRRGRDMTQSNVQRSTKGLSTVALMAGASNLYVETSDAPSLSLRGRREIGASDNGITDSGTLTAVGQTFLGTVDTEQLGRASQLNFADPNTPMPVRDFNTGDWIYNDVNTGTLYRQRVIQWTVQMKSDGTLTGNVVCDTIFQEKINRLNGALNAIQDGTTIIGSSQPAPVVALLFPPKIPTGLAVGSSTYVDGQGITLAQATPTWTAVTQNTNGDPEANLANYLVQFRLHGTTTWSQAAPVSSTATACYLSPFNANTQVDFQVGAIDDQSNFSGWSATVTQTLAADTTPPNQPSTPTVVSKLGQLVIAWNGLDNTSASMPLDYWYTQVHLSSGGSGFTPSSATLVGTMQGAQSLTLSGANLAYNTQYWVKLIALDRSGNTSAASAAGTATLTQVVTTDITTGQVGLSNLSFSDVGNLLDDGAFEDVNWRTTRNAAFGGSHFSFDNTTSSAGTWSLEHTGFSGGTEQVILSTIAAKVGQTFMGACDIQMDLSTTNTMFVAVGVNWLDKTGATISSGDFVTNWTSPSTNDSTWRTRIQASAQTAPANTVQAQFVVHSTAHTAGHVWFDNVEIRLQVDTLLVANAAITDAKIGSVSANKITAGTITAGIIISSTFSTAASGGRVTMDGGADAFEVFDSGGNQLGKWDPTGWTVLNGPRTGKIYTSSATSSGLTPFMTWDVGSGYSTVLPSLYIIQQSNRDEFVIQGPQTTLDTGNSSFSMGFQGATGTTVDDAFMTMDMNSTTSTRAHQAIRLDKNGATIHQLVGGYTATAPFTYLSGSIVQNDDGGFGFTPRFVHVDTFGSGTTDASGNLTISHSAGFTPTEVFVMYNQTGASGGPFCAGVFNITSTTVGTHWESNGASYASSTVHGGFVMSWGM